MRTSTRSQRNPSTILQSDLHGFATPVTKMEILLTGPRHMGFGRRLGESPNTWKHFGPELTQEQYSVLL